MVGCPARGLIGRFSIVHPWIDAARSTTLSSAVDKCPQLVEKCGVRRRTGCACPGDAAVAAVPYGRGEEAADIREDPARARARREARAQAREEAREEGRGARRGRGGRRRSRSPRGRRARRRPGISLYAVVRERGPAWEHGVPMDEQTGWDAHARFMNALEDAKFICLGGPLGDEERFLLIVRARDAEEIRATLAADPWSDDRLVIGSIDPWTLRLGELS